MRGIAKEISFYRWYRFGTKHFYISYEKAYPRLKIEKTINGYFREDNHIDIAQEVLGIKPDLIIVGLGTPKQERFAILLKSMGFQGSIYTCGAFITQTAIMGVKYYPTIINNLHLRWFYRIIKEKKLLKRYILLYPLSIWYLLNDYFKSFYL